MGGSQLKQLKTRLADSGLSRSSKSKNSKKTRTASHNERTSNDKRQAKLASISADFNVFDLKSHKPKHAVLTSRDATKSGPAAAKVSGKPSMSKSTALAQRTRNLLPELLDRKRAGGIIDRRFGESNPHLTLEEKSLERFTRERQLQAQSQSQGQTTSGGPSKRGRLFNLEEEDELTHLGKSLSAFDGDTTGETGFGKADLMQDQAFEAYKRGLEAGDDDQVGLNTLFSLY